MKILLEMIEVDIEKKQRIANDHVMHMMKIWKNYSKLDQKG